jgi:hypothetical protein
MRPRPGESQGRDFRTLARRPHYAKQISGDVGQGARPGPADPNEELWGLIQSRTRQIRCYWYRRIIEGGMTKS